MIEIYIRDINGKRMTRYFRNISEFNRADWSWFDDENYEIQMVVWREHCIYNSLVNEKLYLADLVGFFA